jgi:hypothetical protein
VSWFLQRHLDNFIVTPNLTSIYRDWQKPRHPDADGNSIKPPGRYQKCAVVRRNSAARTASNKMHHDKTPFGLLPVCTPTRYKFPDKSLSGDKFRIPDNSHRQPNTFADAHIKNWHSRHYF